MLTTWGKKCAAIVRGATGGPIPAPEYNQYSKALIEAKTAGGVTTYINGYAYSTSANLVGTAIVDSGANSTVGICVGTGNRAESAADYTLENQIVGITGSTTAETVFDTTNSAYIRRHTITLTNNSGSDVTVKEVGLFRGFFSATSKGGDPSSANNAKVCVMVDRSVLANPVVIPNGESRAVQYDFAYDVS